MKELSIEKIRNQAFSTVKNLIGKEPETVISIEKTDQGWKARVEALERKSVPDTQDILGRYELLFNENGELLSWNQVMLRKRSDRLLPKEEEWIV